MAESSDVLLPVPKLRARVSAKSGGRCWYCGIDLVMHGPVNERLSMDHIDPKSKGGSHDIHNLVPVCRKCNASKGTDSLESWRDRLSKKHKCVWKFWFETNALPEVGKPLENNRHEVFAQLVATGMNHSQAYSRSGFNNDPETSAASASRLLTNVKVKERIEYLQTLVTAKSIERTLVDREWIMTRLRENVERAMQAVPVLTKDGMPTGEYIYEGNVANRALELLGKEIGMLKGEVPQNNQTIINIIKFSDDNSNYSK